MFNQSKKWIGRRGGGECGTVAANVEVTGTRRRGGETSKHIQCDDGLIPLAGEQPYGSDSYSHFYAGVTRTPPPPPPRAVYAATPPPVSTPPAAAGPYCALELPKHSSRPLSIEDYYDENWDYGEQDGYDYVDVPYEYSIPELPELQAADTPLPLSSPCETTGRIRSCSAGPLTPPTPLQYHGLQTPPLPPSPFPGPTASWTLPPRPSATWTLPTRTASWNLPGPTSAWTPASSQPSPLLSPPLLSPPSRSPLRPFSLKGKILPPVPPRPATATSGAPPLDHAAEMARLRSQRIRHLSADEDIPSSPVVVPHKALALLGIKEKPTFGSPRMPSRASGYLDHLLDSDSEDDDEHGVENAEQKYGWEEHRVELPTTEMELAPSQHPAQLTPDTLYFRPQSVCSSFTTSSSVRTLSVSTTLTTMSASSINSGRKFSVASTIYDDDTLRGKSMLNLEDSDDEEEPAVEQDAIEQAAAESADPRSAPTLPKHIMLQICSYFSTPIHHADLPPSELPNRCPNCDLKTLHSLSLTSRSWHTPANTTLYHTISLDFGTFTPTLRDSASTWIPPQYLPFTPHPSLHNTTVHSRLPLLYRTIWDSNGEISKQIKHIKLPRRLFFLTKYPLSAILPKCPNLESLDHAITSGPAEEVRPILEALPKMTAWTWARETAIKGEHAVVAQNSNPARKVSVRIGLQRILKATSHSVLADLFPSWNNLRHLELVKLRRGTEFPEDFDFATLLPNLVSLAVRHVDDDVPRQKSEEIPGLLQKMPRTLKRLELEGCVEFLSHMRLRQYLRQAEKGRLKVLVLREMEMETRALESVLVLAPGVEEVVVVQKRGVREEVGLGIRGETPELGRLRRMCVDVGSVEGTMRILEGVLGEKMKERRVLEVEEGREWRRGV